MPESVNVSGYVVMTDRLYTETHEWVKVEGSKAYIGVTDYAQKELKDVVGVDLPTRGKLYRRGDVLAYLDSVKATAEVYAPVSGVVVKVNEKLHEDPLLINKDPYGDGWIALVELANPEELSQLIGPQEYAAVLERKSK